MNENKKIKNHKQAIFVLVLCMLPLVNNGQKNGKHNNWKPTVEKFSEIFAQLTSSKKHLDVRAPISETKKLSSFPLNLKKHLHVTEIEAKEKPVISNDLQESSQISLSVSTHTSIIAKQSIISASLIENPNYFDSKKLRLLALSNQVPETWSLRENSTFHPAPPIPVDGQPMKDFLNSTYSDNSSEDSPLSLKDNAVPHIENPSLENPASSNNKQFQDPLYKTEQNTQNNRKNEKFQEKKTQVISSIKPENNVKAESLNASQQPPIQPLKPRPKSSFEMINDSLWNYRKTFPGELEMEKTIIATDPKNEKIFCTRMEFNQTKDPEIDPPIQSTSYIPKVYRTQFGTPESEKKHKSEWWIKTRRNYNKPLTCAEQVDICNNTE